MIYLRRVRQSWQRKARRVFLLAARDLAGAWPTVSGTNDAPRVGSVGIASGLGRETLSDGSTAQPKKAQGWGERGGRGGTTTTTRQGKKGQTDAAGALDGTQLPIPPPTETADGTYYQSRRTGWVRSSGRLLVRGPSTAGAQHSTAQHSAQHRQGVYGAKGAGR